MNGDAPKPPPPRKRLSWLRREGIDLGDAAVQFIAVVVGIVLGLFITQWVTHLQQQHAVNEAMHAIRAELVANRVVFHHNAKELYAVANRMLDAPANQNQPPRPCYQWRQSGSGTYAANLTDAAYETAIATQAIAHMTFRQAHKVAKAYGWQRLMGTEFKLFRNRIMYSSTPRTLQTCVLGIEGVVRTERSVDNAYTPIIGPDKTKWPKSPLPSSTHVSK